MSLSEIFMLPGVSGGPRLVISDASESFDFEANSHSFFVNSNLTWSWSSDVAWITSDEDTPQTGSQTFSYSVTENISTQRTGTITFTSGDITRTHTVTQGPYPILTIDDAAHTFDSDADSLTFNVTSNTDWTWFASEDWVTSSEAVFQNGNQAFTYSVTANTGAERTATITFVDVQAGVVTAVHSITQSAEATPLLLDTYTGAVGFSLRKIRTAYTGDCIRVRRASDDAEQDIGFSGNDLDTAAIETFCSGTTGYVTTWYDQVGSNDATQTTAAQQPIIYESGAVVVNEHGQPAINFVDSSTGSVGHHFTFAAWYSADAAYVAQTSAYSMLANGNFAVLAGAQTNAGLWSLHDGSSRQPRAASFRSVLTSVDGTAIALDTTTVRMDVSNRTNLQIYIDKSSTADATASDSNTDFILPTDCTIGNSSVNNIYVADLLVSELICFIADQTSNSVAIRTDQVDYWANTPPGTLAIDSSESAFASSADTGSFEVLSNRDWTWTSSQAWLTSAESSPQNGNQTFSYSVSENTGSERIGTITVTTTGASVLHTVSQLPVITSPIDPGIEDFTEYDYVADMVASMDSAKGVGRVWYAQGYRYVELDGSATNQHLTTAGGVKLRALQDGSGAVTTEQLGWLPAVVQETAANAQIPKLDAGSVLTVTDFYDCDNYSPTVPAGVNIIGAFRRYSGFKSGTQSGAYRQRFSSSGSIRRIKYECDQLNGAATGCLIEADRFIVDDIQMEHKANAGLQLVACSKSFTNNSEFWDAHFNLYYIGGNRIRITDNYFTADWATENFGEGIKTSGSSNPTNSLKIFGCYSDRTRRDGVDLTGGGKAMRITNNVFHLAGVGRDPSHTGVPVQGIDIKTVAQGLPVGVATPIQNLDISDNIFWGSGVLTTQSELDAESAELRFTRGLNGLMYCRNTYESKIYFTVGRGFGPNLEEFMFSCNERTLNVNALADRGAARSRVSTGVLIRPTGVTWIDYSDYIILPSATTVVSQIDRGVNFVGPKITGHFTKFRNQYSFWTRLFRNFEYAQVRLSVSTYGIGDLLQVWSDGGDPTVAGGEGFMIANCFGQDITDLVQHNLGANGKINDVYISGNIVKATNLVNDLGTDIRTGLWIRQNTSDGASARTGAGTTSPVIEQNVGVS